MNEIDKILRDLPNSLQIGERNRFTDEIEFVTARLNLQRCFDGDWQISYQTNRGRDFFTQYHDTIEECARSFAEYMNEKQFSGRFIIERN